MLESSYSGPFEEPPASESDGQMTTTVVGASNGGDEFSITTTGGQDTESATDGGPVLEATTDVTGAGWVDELLADTDLTRQDVELMLQAVYVAVTLAALYYAMEGS